MINDRNGHVKAQYRSPSRRFDMTLATNSGHRSSDRGTIMPQKARVVRSNLNHALRTTERLSYDKAVSTYGLSRARAAGASRGRAGDSVRDHYD